MSASSFGDAKARCRELNRRVVEECLDISDPNGGLSYFGLTSPGMEDVRVLKAYLRETHAVERGLSGREWKWQHDLAVEAVLRGYPGFRLYRGDIDSFITSGRDDSRQLLPLPADIVNLDYTGGITYKDESGWSRRIDAIKALLTRQGSDRHSFVLFITVNDRHHDDGEIAKVIGEVHRAAGSDETTGRALEAIRSSDDRRLAVWIYTAWIVVSVGCQWFRVSPYKPIFYTGGGGYRMLNMSFCLRADATRDAPFSAVSIEKLIAMEPLVLDEENQAPRV